MQGLIDTHCHLDMLKAEIPEILSSAKEAGVEKVITISVDEESQKHRYPSLCNDQLKDSH